LLTIDNLK